MAFKVAARTILQLGSELISSDGVAFYELIKNAFDAQTKKGVRIGVVVRVPYPGYRAFKEALEALDPKTTRQYQQEFTRLKSKIISAVDTQAPGSEESRSALEVAETKTELLRALEEANFIEVRDSGEGMSCEQLSDVYLTIGTRSRLDQRERALLGDRPILGEKGLGRLSTMRLGMRLRVVTSRAGESRWNVLEIDWNKFGDTGATMLSEIDVAPSFGDRKKDPDESGTTIHIFDLNSEWSFFRVRDIARQEFSRLMDPFSPPQMRMFFRFNGEIIPLSEVNKVLFQHADAFVTAEVARHEDGEEDRYELRGEIVYRLRERKKALHLTEDHLVSVAGLQTRDELQRLGPFSMMCYWFNRRRLAAIEGIGDLRTVRALVDDWGGGLMLFRDGFRVHPYGGPADDWLLLDPVAFKSSGYKVNRRQLIGKVDISSRYNPLLKDQTNREGLRDNAQKAALIAILQHILNELRLFVTAVDEEIRSRELLDFDILEARVGEAQTTLEQTVDELVEKYPRERHLASSIRTANEDIKEIMSQAKEMAQGFESRQNQLVHLAGIGLMVEIVAHELNRATQYTLGLLKDSDFDDAPAEVQATLATLESQLKTIQKRLRILDPLSIAGRQVKERFDLVSWGKEILDAHEAQFARHAIELHVKVIPSRGEMRVRAVKGMIVQVIENLVSNSVYWLKRARVDNPSFRPEIEIIFDCNKRQVRFSDNGPGIQRDRREDIFLPFVTTKPAREGKGLGLYIAREIAKYHNGKLYLSEKSTAHPEALNTFIFEIGDE
jgi:signal transduction histidine kinase